MGSNGVYGHIAEVLAVLYLYIYKLSLSVFISKLRGKSLSH
jgi:hypothetical protein